MYIYNYIPYSFQDACRTEQIVCDSMDNLTGLDCLAVICIGLDTSTQRAGARLVPYKGFTRAQLMAAVVNERVDDGWFAFLRRIERDNEFDAAGPIMI